MSARDRERLAFEAWAEVRRRREAMAGKLEPRMLKELDELLEAWRRAHLRDVLAAGGPKVERVARKLLEPQENPGGKRRYEADADDSPNEDPFDPSP